MTMASTSAEPARVPRRRRNDRSCMPTSVFFDSRTTTTLLPHVFYLRLVPFVPARLSRKGVRPLFALGRGRVGLVGRVSLEPPGSLAPPAHLPHLPTCPPAAPA